MDDGCIYPSYLEAAPVNSWENDREFLDVKQILIGEVARVIYPNDPDSKSKNEIEYEVNISIRRDYTAQTTIKPLRCTASNVFGGGDYLRFTYRASSNQKLEPEDKDAYAPGAIVAVFFIDGEQAKGVIIAGLNNTVTKGSPNTIGVTKELGHHLNFEFNGVKVQIDKSGALALQTSGPTDSMGRPTDKSTKNKGTKIAINKDGEASIDDLDGNVIVITKENGIKIISENKGLGFGAKENVNIVSESNVNVIGSSIVLGDESKTQKAVKGNDLKEIIQGLMALYNLYTPLPGTSGAAVSLQNKILFRLNTMLSSKVSLE